MGVLANLDEVAQAQKWESQLPRVVADLMKYDGRFVAVPVNVHRVNWLWVSRAALRKVGSRAPETWDEFFVLADRLQKAGIVPVAHGGQPWQEFTTFETVVLGVAVTVKAVDVAESGHIVAICHRGRERQAIPILELPLPDPLPSGWEWIEAYRRWAKGR